MVLLPRDDGTGEAPATQASVLTRKYLLRHTLPPMSDDSLLIPWNPCISFSRIYRHLRFNFCPPSIPMPYALKPTLWTLYFYLKYIHCIFSAEHFVTTLTLQSVYQTYEFYCER